MSACATQVFANITPDIWTAMKAKAAAEGIVVTDDAGTQTQHGFTVAWAYDAGGQTLSITVTNSPWWAGCGLINGQVHSMVDDALGA